MKHAVPFAGTLVRAARPYWTHTPTSGEGAALEGGRFNPIGVPALYMSFSFETCAREVRFGSSADPYTFYFLQVTADRIADLTLASTRKALAIRLADLASPNWESDLYRGVEPASHALANRLIGLGYSGIIVPSFANGAGPLDHNLVLWAWSDDPTTNPKELARVEVLKRADLPKDGKSWT